MPRGNEVPYHYREYTNGDYFIQEYPSLEDVIKRVNYHRYGDPFIVENEILWGAPGRDEHGSVHDADFVRPVFPLEKVTIPAGIVILLGIILVAVVLRFA